MAPLTGSTELPFTPQSENKVMELNKTQGGEKLYSRQSRGRGVCESNDVYFKKIHEYK